MFAEHIIVTGLYRLTKCIYLAHFNPFASIDLIHVTFMEISLYSVLLFRQLFCN